MKVRTQLPWLNFGECLEILVKRYQRETRTQGKDTQLTLFEDSA